MPVKKFPSFSIHPLRGPFLKTGVIFSNFRQLENLSFKIRTNCFCKEILICLDNFNREYHSPE